MTPIQSYRIAVTVVWLVGSLAADAALGHGVGRPPVDTRGAVDAARSATQGALSAAQSSVETARRRAGDAAKRAAGGNSPGAVDQAALRRQAAALTAEFDKVNSEIIALVTEIAFLEVKEHSSKQKLPPLQAAVASIQREIDEIRKDLSQLKRLKRGEHLADPDTLPFDEWKHYDNQQKNAEQKLFDALDRRSEAEAKLRQAEAEHRKLAQQVSVDRNVALAKLALAKIRHGNLAKQMGQLPPSEQGTWEMLQSAAVGVGMWLAGAN
jgi:predicted  nucleic acid-binding Zn-ribbon protein